MVHIITAFLLITVIIFLLLDRRKLQNNYRKEREELFGNFEKEKAEARKDAKKRSRGS